MTHKVLVWDWKHQVNLEALGAAVREISGGKVDLREVEDTGGDFYAVVVADHPLDDVKASAFLREDRE